MVSRADPNLQIKQKLVRWGIYLVTIVIVISLVRSCMRNKLLISGHPTRVRVEVDGARANLADFVGANFMTVHEQMVAASVPRDLTPFGRPGEQGPAAEADIDGDGSNDFIVAGKKILRLHTTRGNRSYEQMRGVSSVRSVGFADVDGDGAVDAWLSDAGKGRIVILWGDGRGRIAGKQIFDNLNNARATMYDVDGDGRLDIVLESTYYEGRNHRAPRMFALRLKSAT